MGHVSSCTSRCAEMAPPLVSTECHHKPYSHYFPLGPSPIFHHTHCPSSHSHFHYLTYPPLPFSHYPRLLLRYPFHIHILSSIHPMHIPITHTPTYHTLTSRSFMPTAPFKFISFLSLKHPTHSTNLYHVTCTMHGRPKLLQSTHPRRRGPRKPFHHHIHLHSSFL